MTIVAWDFDGVLNRNVVSRRFIWMDEFEADTGHCPDVFSHHVFGDDFAPVMKGHEDLRDRVARWAENVGYEPGPDAFLRYWFEKDVDPDPILLALMDRLDDQGVRQVIVTNNDPRR